MKRFELTFTFLQLPIDYLMLVLAGFAAYALRFTDYIKGIKPIFFGFNLTWEKYWPLVLLVSVGWVVIFAMAGLYHSNPNRKLLRDLTRVIFACSTGFAAITIYVFFTLQKFDSRFLVFAGWILAMIFVCFGRLLMRGLKTLFYLDGIGLRRTIIIGRERVAEDIKQMLISNRSLGYKIIASYDGFDYRTEKELSASHPDEIIFTDPKANEKETLTAIDFANENHIIFKYSADLFATVSSNMAVSTIAGIPIIELRRTRLTGWGSIIKRIFDFLASLILLIVLSPIFLFIWMAILLETGAPTIYKNERVGGQGKKFIAYKFRSMYIKDCTGNQFGKAGEKAIQKEAKLIEKNSVKTGPVYKILNDPRVTPFGRFIRRWSFDELPQLWNVLIGDMSLVGPRPHQPREVEKYEKHHKTVLSIKPGITGMAQISGRSELEFDEEVKLDSFYIEHWSLLIDLIILLKTPFVVIKKKGAW